MRIAHTESSAGWGGQELRILSEAEGLRARGHEVTIVAPRSHRIFAEALARALPTADVPIARKNVRGVMQLRRWLAKHPIEVVNTHSSTDSWLAAIACKALSRAPALVRTRHISAPVPRDPATRWLYTQAAKRVVTTGEALRAQLVAANGFPAERIVSVPTGIDSAVFAPGDRREARRATSLPEDWMLIGMVATLRSWKGHRYLLEAFAQLPAERLGLVIVGGGPQREALETQVKGLGLGGRVWMPGDQQNVVPWLRSLDIFALPSYANEGVPQALVQAMMMALPCVTTAVGAISEAALAGETALIVKPQDSHDLARALKQLIDDTALRAQLGVAARAHCERHFSYSAMLDRMEAIFRDAASSS
jgi:glycosyltransferase involved in cell wall biosynthesis